jgi:hypothetical protein
MSRRNFDFFSLDNEIGEWINRVVSGAERNAKYSFAVILSAIFIGLRKLFEIILMIFFYF